MVNPFEEPFAKPKQRKSGVAGLVGEMFGESAKSAYVKQVGKEKTTAEHPPEDWNGADITMSAEEKAKMQEERELLRLHDIPTFAELPSPEVFEQEFKLDWIWVQQFYEGRALTDFVLTKADLVSVGLDEQIQVRVLESLKKKKESLLFAKVFDIGDLIRQKQQSDPKHLAYLTTKEVFEVMDAAGYRQATFQELLAYIRDCWRRDIDFDTLSEEERERLRLTNDSNVFAFGSPFSDVDGNRFVPSLGSGESDSSLGAKDFGSYWFGDYRLLAIRKQDELAKGSS